ncbi:hypothetical protein BJY00DRAFT_311215 [Aspergillus carlsbadensis]|nr:hypothetical protein BJY00DRAFT_311215 [Aspergillus carlsbadensis]
MSHQSSATRTEENEGKPKVQHEGQPKIQDDAKPKIQNDAKPIQVPAVILTARDGQTYHATSQRCYIYYRQNRRELFNQLHRTQRRQRRKIKELEGKLTKAEANLANERDTVRVLENYSKAKSDKVMRFLRALPEIDAEASRVINRRRPDRPVKLTTSKKSENDA